MQQKGISHGLLPESGKQAVLGIYPLHNICGQDKPDRLYQQAVLEDLRETYGELIPEETAIQQIKNLKYPQALEGYTGRGFAGGNQL